MTCGEWIEAGKGEKNQGYFEIERESIGCWQSRFWTDPPPSPGPPSWKERVSKLKVVEAKYHDEIKKAHTTFSRNRMRIDRNKVSNITISQRKSLPTQQQSNWSCEKKKVKIVSNRLAPVSPRFFSFLTAKPVLKRRKAAIQVWHLKEEKKRGRKREKMEKVPLEGMHWGKNKCLQEI